MSEGRQHLRVCTPVSVLTASVHYQEKRLRELIKWSLKGKCFDLLSNSFNESERKCMMISLENRDLGDQYKSWETVVPTYPSLIEKHFALSKKCREGVFAKLPVPPALLSWVLFFYLLHIKVFGKVPPFFSFSWSMKARCMVSWGCTGQRKFLNGQIHLKKLWKSHYTWMTNIHWMALTLMAMWVSL